MEAESFATGAVSGTILWEVGKQLLSKGIDNIGKKADEKNKLIREEINIINQLICHIQEATIDYFQIPSSEERAKHIATEIRKKLKTASMRLNSLNKQLKNSDLENKNNTSWINFRKACTINLDVHRDEAWNEEDPRVIPIYKSANILFSQLNNLNYTVAV